MRPTPKFLRSALVLFLALAAPASARAQAKGPEDRDRPHDLILAVDVSLSMISPTRDRGKVFPPNDREGLRWDGIQFTVDVAHDQDRIALVLYRAENVVVTRFLDPSGFVRLSARYPAFGGRSGRELLSELVNQLQKLETRWAAEVESLEAKGRRVAENQFRDYDLPLLRGRAGATFRLAHGTASLLTLRAIEKGLLPQVSPPPARAWVFLFTDGEEVGRGQEGTQYTLADYDYIARRKGLEGKRLDDWVRPWVSGFRAKNVPVLTFALGETCDHALLQSVALQSTPPGRQSHRGASYSPRTNVELLDDLRHIQWELREYWTREIGPDRRDRTQELFTTPELGIWRDMGLLLYRLPERAGKRARAPLDAHMRTPPRAGGHDLAGLEPRKGRAYWYYSLAPSDPALVRLPADARLRLLVNKEGPADGDYTTRCVAALRTRRTLFHYREPTAEAAKKYTPRDAIPFEVEFTPYALPSRAGQAIPFAAEDFEVRVTLTPAHRDSGAAPPPVKTFTLPRDEPNAADSLAPRRFTRDLVLDADPASRGNPGLSGLYFIDIEILGVQPAGRRDANPLKGAVRRLIRRTLEIGPYPTLKVTPARVLLVNESAGGMAADVRVELDMQTDPKAPRGGKAVETNVAIELVRGPVLGKDEIAAAQFKITPTPLVLHGKAGTFRVSLPAQTLSARPAGDYDGGTLSLKVPWQETLIPVELAVSKRAYKVHATPSLIRLDLSSRGKSKVARAVRVELETGLDVREKVWLSAADTLAAEVPAHLDFTQVEDERGQRPKTPASARLRVTGLGPEYAAMATNADAAERATLRFDLTPAGRLAPGLYQRKLYLVGPGVESVPLTVNLAVNQVSVRDRAGRPLDELYLLGLAGTDVAYTLEFHSALAARPVRSVAVRPNWRPLKNLSPGGWDQLPLRVQKPAAGAKQVAVGLSVPRCVQEGEYATELTFEVTSADGEGEQLLQVSLPVYVEVRHTGVRFPQKQLDARGALWLHFPEGATAPEFVTRALTLLSDAEKVPVRWSVEWIPAKPGVGQPLAPDDGRLDVLFNGASVLPTGKNLRAKGGPRDPIRRDHPCPLTIKLSRKGLAPGLHRAALRFRSREDRPDAGEGLVNDLEVYMIVPGRGVLTARRGDAGQLFLGGEARVQVEFASFDSEPGRGVLHLLDDKGEPTGPAIPLTRPEASKPDLSVPGKTLHRYQVKVTAARAGTNLYEVRWPRFRAGDGPESDVLVSRVSLEAQGVIEARNRVVGVNEDVLIRATVGPAHRPEAGSPLILHVIDRADKERDPVRLELYDDGKSDRGDERAGDGVYAVRHRFAGSGTYDIVSPEGEGPLRAEVVQVSYEFRAPDRLGTLEYGGGDWLRWLGIHEELSDPHAIQLANRRPERCRWRARLLFPKGGLEAQQATARNVDSLPTSFEPDPRVHLQTRLTGPGAADAGPVWALGGVLQQDQEVELGVESKLSQAAADEVSGESAANAAPHPALGKSSTVLLELELEWLDDQGQVVERRATRIPLVITTRHWALNPKPWILGGAFLVALFVLARVVLRMVRRGHRPAAPAVEVASPTPTPRPERPREAAPPRLAGGNDTPEHMR